MKLEIVDKLDKFLLKHSPFSEECEVVYLLVEIRKILEHDQDSNFKVLKFFCDWSVHTQKDRQMAGIIDIASKIDQLVSTVDKITTEQHEQILKFFEMSELRDELSKFFTMHSLPLALCEGDSNWSSFVDVLTQVLSNQPINNPISTIKLIEIVSNAHGSQITIDFGDGRGSTTDGFGK